MKLEELQNSIEDCYDVAFIDHNSNNLVITFTPASSFFLYKYDLQAKKLCISSKLPNYYIYNPGSSCKLLAKFIVSQKVENIIVIGSSKAGFASLLWGHLLNELLKAKGINLFTLSFSPQTQLYPFNKNLNFPSYAKFYASLSKDSGLEKCAKTYGDIPALLKTSDLKGMVIYPENNQCDKDEALRLAGSSIQLRTIDSPLHGTIFPYMINTQNHNEVWAMVDKLYSKIDLDADLKNTLPEKREELFDIISKLRTPSLKELCSSIFVYLDKHRELGILKEYRLLP